jgi:hypothetical protein
MEDSHVKVSFMMNWQRQFRDLQIGRVRCLLSVHDPATFDDEELAGDEIAVGAG